VCHHESFQPRLLVYERYQSDHPDQAASRQLESILPHLLHGAVVNRIVELGTGGAADRPMLTAVEAAVATGQIDAVVVTDLTRVSRCSEDCKRLQELCRTHGTKLLSVEAIDRPSLPTPPSARQDC